MGDLVSSIYSIKNSCILEHKIDILAIKNERSDCAYNRGLNIFLVFKELVNLNTQPDPMLLHPEVSTTDSLISTELTLL